MYLRYSFSTKGRLRAPYKIAFPIQFSIEPSSDHNRPSILTTVREKTREEQYKTGGDYHYLIEIGGEFKLSSECENVLECLPQKLVQSSEDSSVWNYRKEDETVVPYPELRSNFFPSDFENEIQELRQRLSSWAVAFVEIFRWRLNEPFFDLADYPFRMEFSLDRALWYPLPENNGPTSTVGSIRMVRYNSLPLEMNAQEDILNLSSKLIDEGAPVYHSLLIEAIGQFGNNPRSALIMSVAALEAAAKRCISELIPQTTWLLDNMPSPSVFKILRDYIPTLPARNLINGKVVIPKAIRSCIQDGVEIRNKIIHVGEIPEKEQESKGYTRYRQNLRRETYSLLFAIRDMVWLLDYYQGQAWALDYVRKSTLESMNIEGRGDSSGVF